MRVGNICAALLSSAASLTLAACGSAGIATAEFIPPPQVTPTPSTCSPNCFTTANIFPAIIANTQFSTIGLEASGGNTTMLTSTGFAVRYDASAGLYVMDFPATEAGAFHAYTTNTPDENWWGGEIQDSSGKPLATASVLKPANPTVPLTYTSFVGYNYTNTGIAPFGWAAFGTATPAGSVPVTGAATYSALAQGSSVDGQGEIGGTASLSFDFAAGQLSGRFDPTYNWLGNPGIGPELHPIAGYTFANTVYATGSTTFSGQLATAALTTPGLFNGEFNGPGAQELMATWTAPFRDPIKNVDSTMFGVWVGAKGPGN